MRLKIVKMFTKTEFKNRAYNIFPKRSTAFSLAEILVTMGVIGVVAAMTFPMLARNYNWFIRQQQFKKAHAALTIAVQKTQIDMGENVRCYYFRKSNNTYSYGNLSDCSWFYSELANNLQMVKHCDGNAREKRCLPEKGWRGGEIVYSEVQGGNDPEAAKDFFMRNCSGFTTDRVNSQNQVYQSQNLIIMPFGNYSFGAFDINGLSGPNKWGHDIFTFLLAKDKATDSVFKIYPYQGCHPIEKGGYYTNTFLNYLYGQNSEL